MVQTLSIRMKLIMAMIALVASVALMGVTADAANAAVTEIRWVENHTRFYVYVENHETDRYMVIPPHSAVFNRQLVPWATNAAEFNRGKYIELGFEQFSGRPDACFFLSTHCPELAIWQEGHNRQPYPGDKVRYTRTIGVSFRYTSNAPPMPGASNAGGRRNLIIWHTTDPTTGFAVMQARLVQW